VPGPSAGDVTTRMPLAGGVTAGLAILLVTATTGIRFLLENATIGRIDQTAVAGSSALVASTLLWLVFGRTSPDFPSLGIRRAALLAVAGAAVLAVAPLGVLLNRHSDAPPGSIVLFWSVAVPGAVLLAGVAPRAREAGLVRAASSLLALVGVAGILANWERPSSFSLLARYPSEQIWIGVAAVASAVSILYIGAVARDLGWPKTAPVVAAGGAAAGAVLLVLGGLGDASFLSSPTLWMHAATFAVAVTLVVGLAAVDPVYSGAALLAVPVALSGVTFAEAAIGALGPRPLLLGAVGWGSATVLAAVALGLLPDKRQVPFGRTHLPVAGRAAAVLGAGTALAALIAPGVDVAVRGVRTEGAEFSADFTMVGFETVGAWLALGIGAVVMALLFRGGASRARAVLGVGTVAVGVAAWFSLHSIPLHTWVAWIPSDVQQDYGTEYASIVFSQIAVPWQWASVISTSIAALVLGWLALRHDSAPVREIDPVREGELT